MAATLPKDWVLSPGECLDEHDTAPSTLHYSDFESSEIQSLDDFTSLSGELLNTITIGDQEYYCLEFEISFAS